jgi:hypothetical protein
LEADLGEPIVPEEHARSRNDVNPSKICYVDFDGVLHVDSVYQSPKRGIYVGITGHTLFEWLPILDGLLAPYPEVKIVLSTSWVPARSFQFAKSKLTTSLQARVIGATFHNRYIRRDEFDIMPRGVQVWNDVIRRQPESWFAIDDDDDGWPTRCRDCLVKTDGRRGLSDQAVQDSIRTILKSL